MANELPQQIQDLMARNEVRKKAGEAEGKMYFAVHTQWAEGVDKDKAPLPEHLAYQLMLEENGIMFAAGGLTHSDDTRAGGLIVIRAPSFEKAMEIATNDPMHKSGFRHFNLYRWRMNEGRITFTLNLSTGQSEMV